MPNQDFIFSVNTLVGCKYSILRELEEKFHVEKGYQKIYRKTKFLSILTTGLSYFDELRYQSLSKNLEIKKDPIYILGHWRSGTTLLHNLLCCHENISYPTTYQTVFPNNLFFLKGLIKEIMRIYLPKKRLVDGVEMHVDFPQEEDFALGNEAGYSFYYWFYFPADYQRVTDEFLTLSTEDEERSQKYKKAYQKFVKRSILNVGGEQYIAKNPPNMARIPFLLDIFPGSRFIYIERNPYEVLMSTFKFHKGFLKTLQLQDIDDETLWEFIFQTYVLTYNKYEDSKHLIPSENLAELKYEDLVADPGKAYKSLQMGIISDLETDPSKLKSVIEANMNHSVNTYNFDRKYIDRVNSALGSVIEKQGYQIL
jgi:hypothetical protein